MHLVNDENGHPIGHSHGQEQAQEHCHEHCGDCEKDCDPKKEALALLTYMLHHNEHHAAELDQLADNLGKLGMEDAAKQIREGVGDFQKGNMRLSLAVTLVKEQMKED